MHNDQQLLAAADAATARQRTAMEGIALRRALAARYNGVALELAPHMLFERHGHLFLGAVNRAKAVREGELPRLGQFRLDALSELEVLPTSFEPLSHLVNSPPRPDDTVIFAV